MWVLKLLKKHPVINFNKLYHVGTMEKKQKRKGGYEGSGLSVSLHPNEWQRIAKGYIVGNIFELKKENNQLLNVHGLSEVQKNEIYEWGVKKEYIERAILYRVEYFDDEWDCNLRSDFENEESAEIEAEGRDIEVQEIKSFVSTEVMKEKTNNDANTMIFDLLVTLFAEEELKIDGAWWNDKLDVLRLSAPRGVISSSMLDSWEVSKLDD